MESKLTAKDIVPELLQLLVEDNLDFQQISKLSKALIKFDDKFQHFEVDARTLIHLGRDSIKDHTTALIELVKNSYDADAHNVDVDIFSSAGNDLIRVSDNGFGMTKEQLINNWLRIGFSGKRQSKLSDLGRRKTGEKGIGRISTDRLGAQLELISKTKSDGIVGLKINWDDFDTEGKDIFDIPIEIIRPSAINIPNYKEEESLTGTEIKITKLRQTWTKSNIESLYNELSALTPPFREQLDFQIKLANDITQEYSKPINSRYFETAEIDVTAIFDGSDEVYYSIKDKYSKKEIVDTITLQTFYAKAKLNDKQPTLSCGPLQVRLLFFLREVMSVAGTEFKLSDLRKFLDNNNGVKIYRDNVAVKPYGFPTAQMGYDWLGIGEEKARNPAGIGRGDEFTVSPNQLVGAVFITRDQNTLLTDSAAREGLVESEAFADMKEFVQATKRLLETHRGSIYSSLTKEREEKRKPPVYKEAEKISEKLEDIREVLSSVKNRIVKSNEGTPTSALLQPLESSIEKVETIKDEVEVTISDLLSWQRVLNGLATIGISSAVFGHETEGAITQFQGSINTALKVLKLPTPKIDKAIIEIDKAVKSSNRVAAWGAYALTRVQKEKRTVKIIPVHKTIESVLIELRPAFDASTITLSFVSENIYCRTYQMDIETILVNLLTNAYTASTLKGGERKVVVTLKAEDLDNTNGFFFSVADTGPGIAKEFEKRIFVPLFSTKRVGVNDSKSVGTGLGLTIVKSIVDELNGEISFSKDKTLGGANFKVWLPKNPE